MAYSDFLAHQKECTQCWQRSPCAKGEAMKSPNWKGAKEEDMKVQCPKCQEYVDAAYGHNCEAVETTETTAPVVEEPVETPPPTLEDDSSEPIADPPGDPTTNEGEGGTAVGVPRPRSEE